MIDKAGSTGSSHASWRVITSILAILVSFSSLFPAGSNAQTPPITPSGGLQTQISGPISVNGQIQYDITGGTRPGGGANLFHSFGEFGVSTNNIANFLNETALPTSNILGRVTGGNISHIFGAIQTEGFGNANLFLMNPAGFLFGPNATVNVGGLVAFTSADYLRLADNARFNAIPNATFDVLLTPSPVAAFGFLGSNPGAITVQGSRFTVTEGTGISLVGGNITIQSGTPEGGTTQPAQLSAPNSKIQLASAASPGEFDAATLQALPNVDGTSFTSFGSVTLTPGSGIDLSGTNTVSIRAGQFVLSVNDALLTTAGSPSTPEGESVTLSPESSIFMSNGGTDPGADLELLAANIQLDGASVRSTTSGDGSGGNISVISTSLSLTNGTQIVSSTEGAGHGGNISATGTDSVTISGFDSDGTLPGVLTDGIVRSGIFTTSSSTGTGGDITVSAPTFALDQLGTIASTTINDGRGGDITVSGGTLTLTEGGEIRSETGRVDPDTGEFVGGIGQGGNITISTNESVLLSGLFGFSRSGITASTLAGGTGSNITVSSPRLSVENGSSIRSFTVGDGVAGNITITASDSFSVRGFQDISIPGIPFDFRIASSVSSEAQSVGNGGSVNISAGTMAVENQGYIQTITFGQGRAGDLTVNGGTLNISGGGFIDSTGAGEGATGIVSVTAAGALSIQGSPEIDDFNQSRISNTQNGEAANDGIFIHTKDIVMTEGGRIRNDTVSEPSTTILIADNSITIASSSRIASRADADSVGPIELSAQIITLDQGSITTRTATAATGGAITLNGHNITLTNGSELASATEQSSGQGGPITVSASDSITVLGGSTVQSISFADGPAGDVDLNAMNSIALSGSGTTVSTQTVGTGAGGAITLQSQNISVANGAMVTAKSTGSGAAGSINITSLNGFTMQNSTITTEAGQGAGGGDIKVTTSPEATVLLQNSLISASVADGRGGGGNIEIDPQYVILQNSQILAQAAQGQGGAITITANLFLPDATSIVNADSGSGLHGTVTIQSPNAPSAGEIIPLSQEPLLPTSLLTQRCAALAGGEFSSFTVAGRDNLPTEPGSWLASPLVAFGAGEGLGVRGEGIAARGEGLGTGKGLGVRGEGIGVRSEGREGLGAGEGLGVRGEGLEGMTLGASPSGETALLSLRQIAPAGFLTQAFALDWSAGCQS